MKWDRIGPNKWLIVKRATAASGVSFHQGPLGFTLERAPQLPQLRGRGQGCFYVHTLSCKALARACLGAACQHGRPQVCGVSPGPQSRRLAIHAAGLEVTDVVRTWTHGPGSDRVFQSTHLHLVIYMHLCMHMSL